MAGELTNHVSWKFSTQDLTPHALRSTGINGVNISAATYGWVVKRYKPEIDEIVVLAGPFSTAKDATDAAREILNRELDEVQARLEEFSVGR